MPFGLDLKSLILGALIAYFVVPWLIGFLSRNRNAAPGAA